MQTADCSESDDSEEEDIYLSGNIKDGDGKVSATYQLPKYHVL